MMGYGGFGGMGFLGQGGMLVSLVIWVLVVALIVWGVSALFRRVPRSDEDPLTILQRRYAHGEIDEAEYERAKHTLA